MGGPAPARGGERARRRRGAPCVLARQRPPASPAAAARPAMGLVTIAAAPLCSAPSPAARPSAAAGRAALIMRRGVEPARAQGLRWALRREATQWDGCCAAAGGRACLGPWIHPPRLPSLCPPSGQGVQSGQVPRANSQVADLARLCAPGTTTAASSSLRRTIASRESARRRWQRCRRVRPGRRARSGTGSAGPCAARKLSCRACAARALSGAARASQTRNRGEPRPDFVV